MKIANLPPIHLACGKDDMRQNFQYVEIKNGIASATNGRIVAQINLSKSGTSMSDKDIESLNGCYIDKDVWEQLINVEMIKVGKDTISCSSSYGWKSLPLVREVSYPDIQAIVKRHVANKTASITSLSFDPVLMNLAQSIFPSQHVKMRFYGDDASMFIIYPIINPYGFVGIMPVVSNESKDFDLFSIYDSSAVKINN